MTNLEMAQALNEWMRRYIEAPEQFNAEFRTVGKFLQDEKDGVEPSYGTVGAAYMQKLHDELRTANG